MASWLENLSAELDPKQRNMVQRSLDERKARNLASIGEPEIDLSSYFGKASGYEPLVPSNKAEQVAPATFTATPSNQVPTSVEYKTSTTKSVPNTYSGKLDELIANIQGKKEGINWKPLLSYVDSQYGGNLAGSYAAPMTEDEKNMKLAGLLKAKEDMATTKEELSLKRLALMNEAGKATKGLNIKGFRISGEPTEQDAKGLKEKVIAASSIKGAADELSYLIKNTSQAQMLNPQSQARARMKQLATMTVIPFRTIMGLGTLSESDKALLERLASDPSKFGSMLAGSSVQQAQIKQLLSTLDDQIAAHAYYTGYEKTDPIYTQKAGLSTPKNTPDSLDSMSLDEITKLHAQIGR